MTARWVFASLLLATTAQATPHKLDVDEAVKAALDANPRILAARARLEAARNQSDSVRGRYGPSLNVMDEFQHYNSNFGVAFPIAASLAPLLNPIFTQLQVAPPAAQDRPFIVRTINTNTLAVSGYQPLLGLLEISQNHLSAIDQARAAEQQVKALEANVREEVQTLMLRLFEARATENIARTSQAQLGEQLAVARSKLAAGVLTNADVLRVVVAEANARQQEIQAQAQEQASRAALLADLSLPQTDETDFEEPTALENAPAPPQLTDALALAEKGRPEISSARYVQSAASHQGWAKLFHILPSLDLEAAYLHIDGQSFAEKDAGYVGLKLTWNVWSWGVDYYAQRAAAAQELAASFDTESVRHQIGMDLSARLSQERAATAAVEVAQTAIASAEEAYRVTEALVKAGSATTTDLLDSQSALTQAKLNLVRARYQQAIARVAVKRGVGG